MPKTRRMMLVAAVAVLGAACQSERARDVEAADRAELAQVQKDSAELTESLEATQARLLSSRATVKLWKELSVRHRQVSEVACSNASQHLQGMAWQDSRKVHGREARKFAELTTGVVRIEDAGKTAASAPNGQGGPAAQKQ